jgi:hypothetical protein
MIQFSRQWAMPSADTFDIPPIREFVKKYLRQSKVSIDPFARNKRWATYTNDLNPDTAAEYHMPALEFLKMLREKGVQSDIIIFDPPYTIQQVKQVYESFGAGTFTAYDAQNAVRWTDEKEVAYDLLAAGGVFLNFGYNTMGLGKNGHCEIVEILIVAHGPAHYDTLCMAERKIAHQAELMLDMERAA